MTSPEDARGPRPHPSRIKNSTRTLLRGLLSMGVVSRIVERAAPAGFNA
eukprot:CAMPEP_0172202224 /NCGR_PEP_ID=MMETSP1050-20130122/30513_1 /TAXON_ID=233186 /ORGANISM="Cryptomonas curvata, Strain CCAP979/52" /LENGTH=48 /DNA_ID= /DNA_START= /DNA_END= /DNA_ORIENTATION=